MCILFTLTACTKTQQVFSSTEMTQGITTDENVSDNQIENNTQVADETTSQTGSQTTTKKNNDGVTKESQTTTKKTNNNSTTVVTTTQKLRTYPSKQAEGDTDMTLADKYAYHVESMNSIVADDRILVLGRASVNGNALQLKFTHAGFTISGYMKGDVSAQIQITAGDPNPMFRDTFQVVIDGKADTATRTVLDARPSGGTKELLLAHGLTEGYHTITITKGNCYTYSISNVLSIAYSGTLEKPKKKDLQIEFIGDSITSAVSMDATASDARAMSGFDGYSAQVAKALNADLSQISASGSKVATGARSLSSLFNDQNWDFAANPRDIVVINLGTNDWGWPGSTAAASIRGLKETCHQLIADVRAKYGKDTYIIWAYGMMFDKDIAFAKDTIVGHYQKAYNDDKVLFCDLSAAKDTNGGDKHPSKAGHTNAANILTKFIQDNCL